LQVLPFLLAPHSPSVETFPPVQPVPKPDWHPAPQWSVEFPHQPLAEQQLPNDAPVQILPLAAPHWPSVVMVLGGHVPKSVWHPAPQCSGASPHRPPAEQHAPKEEPVQLYRAVPPHEPSGDGTPVHGGALQLPYWGWLVERVIISGGVRMVFITHY
jgi:hypothetical protein